MIYTKVKIGFGQDVYRDWNLVGKATHIYKSMKDNPLYPNPNPTMEEVFTAIGLYTASLGKAVDGSKKDTVNKKNSRKALEYLLRDLGGYVQTISAGDEAKILSAGFDTRKLPQVPGPLEQPMGLIVEQDSNSGTVHLSCAVVEHAHSYAFEYTASPLQAQSVWLSSISTKRKSTFGGLTSGQLYIFRVSGIGSDPTRTWSEPVIRMVI